MDDTIRIELNRTILAGKYLVKEKLGSGSFGTIFKAEVLDTNEIVAIKIERPNLEGSTLHREARVLSELNDGFGFPHLLFYTFEENTNIMVMSCLAQNLEKLFKHCNYKFSLKTVLMIGDQMLTRIEFLHSKGFLHRDIKPENFVMGAGKSSKNVHLIDFGLSKPWKDATGKHIPYREGKSLVGTARYASVATHKGYEQSRRDDVEAIGYVLIYFLLGKLPWQNLKFEEGEDKYAKIAAVKAATSVEDLCKNIPGLFLTYLNYSKNLPFTAEPDYKYLKKLMRKEFLEQGHDFDYHYDWMKPADNKGPSLHPAGAYLGRKEIENFKKLDDLLARKNLPNIPSKIDHKGTCQEIQKIDATTPMGKNSPEKPQIKVNNGKPEVLIPTKVETKQNIQSAAKQQLAGPMGLNAMPLLKSAQNIVQAPALVVKEEPSTAQLQTRDDNGKESMEGSKKLFLSNNRIDEEDKQPKQVISALKFFQGLPNGRDGKDDSPARKGKLPISPSKGMIEKINLLQEPNSACAPPRKYTGEAKHLGETPKDKLVGSEKAKKAADDENYDEGSMEEFDSGRTLSTQIAVLEQSKVKITKSIFHPSMRSPKHNDDP